MPKFRKKPVVIEALMFDGINFEEIYEFTGGQSEPSFLTDDTCGMPLIIPTLEGDHIALPGDIIIRGVAGEFYACKPGVFAKTYEIVEEEKD